jgi:glutathione synthase/RimK-type ligase-like ATP-grasp enzyme
MLRRADHWVTNRARGAVCQAVALDPAITSLAEAAVRTVEVDYAGVDLVRDRRGQFLVTEVNSIPAWRGLQSVCSVNIAERIVDHFLSRVAAAGNLEALS